RASAKVSEVSSLTARAHPTVVAHVCGACAGLFGGRVTNKIGCVNADDLFLRRAAFRLERVEHAQVSEFAGDTHPITPLSPPSTSCCTRSPGLATLARGCCNDPLRVSFHHF